MVPVDVPVAVRVPEGIVKLASETPLFVLHVIGLAGFLWLGLYVVARGQRSAVSVLTGGTALATTLFFLCGSMEEALHDGPAGVWLALDRLSWLCDVAPVTLWLHLSLCLNPHAASARWRRPLLWASYGAAASIVILGAGTNLVRDYITLRQDPAGPLYGLYTGYVLICTGLATANLVALMRGDATRREETADPSQAPVSALEVRLLVGGALCFLAGGGYESLRELLRAAWPELVAYLLLLTGLGAVLATIAVRSALLLGIDVRRDFLYSGTVLVALVAALLGLTGGLVGFDDARNRWLIIGLVVVITPFHPLSDRMGEWLDRVFFSTAVREERAAARAYIGALATPPAGPSPELATCKQFDDAVRRALTHLTDPTRLATSPLLNLTAIARSVQDHALEDNRLNRAAVLAEILVDLVEALKPADGRHGVVAEAARFYNCLYYPYVRGIGRRRWPGVLRQLQERRQREGGPRADLERVVEWLMQLDEATFHKWQRRASDTLAAALRERERAAGGPAPVETPSETPRVPVAVPV